MLYHVAVQYYIFCTAENLIYLNKTQDWVFISIKKLDEL